MRIVLYTQRVDVVESYGERRDCIDQNIPRFFESCGYLPIGLSNVLSITKTMVEILNPVGIVLTGGNSLQVYGGNAPERDEIDRFLIKTALEKQIPLYGFCRGMQSILDYFGCILENVKGHVAVRHIVRGLSEEKMVNSYHNQCVFTKNVKEPLEVIAETADGVAEAIRYRDGKIIAVMWHPEREVLFDPVDKDLVISLFGKE